ncbi:Pimeloyl-ACP methyl ester carboxylesterase [Loktanella fryxellensis]|uniref:Pimeloyl-ACP methyl ester carboxylesterase n=1 Tax=Loktanella fryxellensis TaxID=245187 RepID=A0A1H7Z9F3_9RHOB|nr:alpha/beta hydrolase [Loktanella fryxellensis]SEM54129.1 Pimeloyl-ACP methyl ester carboxylesterase [Loktanella fryxellensis]
MPMIDTRDGTRLYVNDWGQGQPVVLIHGWPLNADSWEYQSVRLAEAGYRVIAYDRRGFGRSDQPFTGYDYDTLADDLADVMAALDLQDAVIAGFSMGGGEVVRYLSRHGGKGVSKAMLIASVAPYMAKTDDNPDGTDASVFDGMKDGLRDDRQSFFVNFFKDFTGHGLPSSPVPQPGLDWMWGMAMQANPKATIDCVTAFGTTDFRPDMAHVTVPTLIIHGDADKIVPIDAAGAQAARMLPDATYKVYPGAPHALTATHKDELLDDMLAFLRS